MYIGRLPISTASFVYILVLMLGQFRKHQNTVVIISFFLEGRITKAWKKHPHSSLHGRNLILHPSRQFHRLIV